ncbi:MAG: PH domain-containing protein [Pseudomonadota bacterium]
MAISTQNGVTVLTPTNWKWFVGAAGIFFFIPPFGMLIALVFVLTGAGVLQRLTLTKDGITIRNWFSEKTYAWSDIDDFRIQKVKSGVVTAANMVAFTHVDKQGTMMGKAAKLLAGGTHSIPAVGMKPQKLIQIMHAYKTGHVPQDTPQADLPAPAAAPVTAHREPRQTPKAERPRAVAATPRAQKKSTSKPANFGGTRKAATPLVQDGGGLFGRRRSDSPFQS